MFYKYGYEKEPSGPIETKTADPRSSSHPSRVLHIKTHTIRGTAAKVLCEMFKLLKKDGVK
jgi:hypothetical protein